MKKVVLSFDNCSEWFETMNSFNFQKIFFMKKKLIFDFDKKSVFSSRELTFVKCCFDYALKKEIDFEVILPRNNNAKDYSGRYGLYEGVKLCDGVEYTYRKNENSEEKFIALKKINNDRNEDLTMQIISLIRLVDGPIIPNLYVAISELLDNIYFHSEEIYGNGWGYLAAEFHQERSVWVSIRDVGQGIANSYKKRVNDTRAHEIIVERAFDELNSSTGDNKRGLGLNEVKDFFSKGSSSFELKTGKSIVKINNEGIKINFDEASTLIGVDILMRIKWPR